MARTLQYERRAIDAWMAGDGADADRWDQRAHVESVGIDAWRRRMVSAIAGQDHAE